MQWHLKGLRLYHLPEKQATQLQILLNRKLYNSQGLVLLLGVDKNQWSRIFISAAEKKFFFHSFVLTRALTGFISLPGIGTAVAVINPWLHQKPHPLKAEEEFELDS